MVRTEVHLSIGGMSGAYLFESQPSENVTSQERKYLAGSQTLSRSLYSWITKLELKNDPRCDVVFVSS